MTEIDNLCQIDFLSIGIATFSCRWCPKQASLTAETTQFLPEGPALDNREDQKLDWDTYYDTRRTLDELRISQQNAFDKAILTISSSALAFSLVVMTALVGEAEINKVWLLVSSWCCFSVSIVINLLSYLVAEKALAKEIECLDETMSADQPVIQVRNIFVKWTKRANILAILSLIVGIATLLSFALANG